MLNLSGLINHAFGITLAVLSMALNYIVRIMLIYLAGAHNYSNCHMLLRNANLTMDICNSLTNSCVSFHT